MLYPRRFYFREAVKFLSSFFRIVSFISTLVIGLLFIYLFPKFNQAVSKTITTSFWAALGVGLLFLIITPVIVIGLMITVVALPLGLLLLFGYILYIYLVRIFVMTFIGRWALEKLGKKPTEAWAFLVGLILYYFLAFIPVLGNVLSFVVLIIGLGAVLLTKKDFYKSFKQKNLL